MLGPIPARSFKIDEGDELYGHVKEWSTHVLIGTGKTDWVRDVADEKGSVMEAVARAEAPKNGVSCGRLSPSTVMLREQRLTAAEAHALGLQHAHPHDTSDYAQPTTVLLLPAFTLVDNVHPRNVPLLLDAVIDGAPTNTSPLRPSALPRSVPGPDPSVLTLATQACPHSAVILMCGQKTRDARCGQSAPLLRKELERHLRPLGLYRDLHDERPGGVAIYFISHVSGHKYSANVMVYRRPNAFGQDDVGGGTGDGQDGSGDVGAAQCIWLARVRPKDCENLVRHTVLKGNVVKPESQLRGGFDRAKGLTSW